jgi:hypothetical protein
MGDGVPLTAKERDAVVQGILRGESPFQAPTDSFADAVARFCAAVTWTQPWLIALIAFHVVILVWLLAVRKSASGLALTFATLLALGLAAKPLNTLAAEHWRDFADQPYFDDGGFFAMVVYAFPLVVNAVVALCLILKLTGGLLIQVKRAEIVAKRRESAKEKSS